MPVERLILRTGEIYDHPCDEATLAAAIFGQCDQDIEVFLRFMKRHKVNSTLDVSHHAMWCTELGATHAPYREAYYACRDAIEFLCSPERHEDRNFWCEMIGVDEQFVVRKAFRDYGALAREIILGHTNIFLDNPSNIPVWIEHNLCGYAPRKSKPGKKSVNPKERSIQIGHARKLRKERENAGKVSGSVGKSVAT